MRIAFQPSLSDLIESYLATHYSGGVQTMRRLAGGPVILLLGALTIIAVNAWVVSTFLRILLIALGFLFALYGLWLTLTPVFNMFLLWLRRDELLGDQPTILELKDDRLMLIQGDESLELPLDQIKSIQHRGHGTWLLTAGDHLISIPREGLLEGDHDAFINALEVAMAYEAN